MALHLAICDMNLWRISLFPGLLFLLGDPRVQGVLYRVVSAQKVLDLLALYILSSFFIERSPIELSN